MSRHSYQWTDSIHCAFVPLGILSLHVAFLSLGTFASHNGCVLSYPTSSALVHLPSNDVIPHGTVLVLPPVLRFGSGGLSHLTVLHASPLNAIMVKTDRDLAICTVRQLTQFRSPSPSNDALSWCRLYQKYHSILRVRALAYFASTDVVPYRLLAFSRMPASIRHQT